MFLMIMTAWTTFVEGQQGNIPAKLYWNQSIRFWQDFLVFYIDI